MKFYLLSEANDNIFANTCLNNKNKFTFYCNNVLLESEGYVNWKVF